MLQHCTTVIFFLIFLLLCPHGFQVLKTFIYQTASFQNDSSSQFKIKSCKMSIKVLAEKNSVTDTVSCYHPSIQNGWKELTMPATAFPDVPVSGESSQGTAAPQREQLCREASVQVSPQALILFPGV